MQSGIERLDIIGSAPDDTHQERGFGLLCSMDEARALAVEFDQLAFYWIDAGRVSLIDTVRRVHLDLGEWACRVRPWEVRLRP